MDGVIATQMIGCETAAAVWKAVNTMYGAQSRANVRHICRLLQSTRKEDMSAAAFMHKMKGFADTMAAAGAPITDDELVDHLLTGLGSAYNAIAANYTVGNKSVSYSEFYSHVLSFEALQAQQAQAEGWSSSVNAVMRPNQGGGTPYQPYGYDGQQGQGRNGGGNNGYGRNDGGGGGYGRNDGGYGRNDGGRQGGGYGRNDGGRQGGGNGGRNDGGRNGGGNGGNRRWRPRCQLCGIWGHEVANCRNRFDSNFQPPQQPRSGHAATTHPNNNNPWIMDSGTTDHLTSELARLHTHERYDGKDQVQVANGAGLSISHIGHSLLTGSSLHLKNIVHVPDAHLNLLSVYRLVSDNDVFVEFHRHFFCVKDKATGRVLLLGRSQGGLYPILFVRASSSSRHASAGVTSRHWHHRLGHPSNNIVKNIVRTNELSCAPPDNTSVVCDACQRAKSHQLPYSLASRVSTEPLELIHTDVWGPASVSSGGYKYYVSFVDDYSRFCWIYLLKHKSDVEQVFYAFQTHVERLVNAKIKAVQSDWGGEYHRLHSYFERTGIVHRVSCPHTSQQNGIAERKHRHLVETGLALLAHSQLLLRYWDEAFLTACYLINRMPTPVINKDTPLFRLTRVQPNYDFLRIFGCAC